MSSYEYTISISEDEQLALQATTGNIEEWISNAVKNRARIAISDIVTTYVAQALQNNWNIPKNKTELIKAAIEKLFN